MTENNKVDVKYLSDFVLGSWAETRRTARKMMENPEFHKIDGLTMQEHRERVLGQLKLLVKNKAIARAYPKEFGGEDAHGASLAAFQELILGDPSSTIKSGVQWGLFGSAILHLGTAEHHKKYFKGLLSLEIPGIYAMTETGHGSDVDSIATTASYDPETQEFVINTPFRGAWKDYLGNAALHGIAAVVFAQLITNGVNHGVHAFYVPVRDENGKFLPGVGGEDDGYKGGLNGIDNGRLHFSNVRIPRTNLLNRYGDVAEDGTYSSPIESPGRRFFTMLGALVQGRVSLDGAANIASQLGLYIAITYATQRRQFSNATGDEEVVLLDYQRHQRRLFTRLAKAYAGTFAHDTLLKKFDGVFSGAEDSQENREDLETIAAALKAVSTWQALDTLQEVREATGGAGFLAANRVAGLRADLDIFVTFEGDNNVLLQLVGKRLLTDYSKKVSKNPAGVILGQIGSGILNSLALRKLGQKIVDLGSPKLKVSILRRAGYQEKLLLTRVEVSIARIGAKLAKANRGGKEKAAAAFNSVQNELINTAVVYAEYLQLQEFNKTLNRMTDQGTKKVMTDLRDLFSLGLIDKYSSWFSVNGYLSAGRVKAASAAGDQLLAEIRPHALDLVNAFEFSPAHVRADIASGAEAERQDEARAYFEQLKASGKAPVHEKELRRKQKAQGK